MDPSPSPENPRYPPPSAPSAIAPAAGRGGLALIALLMLVIIVLAGLLAHSAQDEVRELFGTETADTEKHQTKKASSRVSQDDGETVVVLPKAVQDASGIQTSELKPVGQTVSSRIFATVPILQGLFELRGRHQAAQSDIRAARAALNRSSAELQRLQALYADDRNVSKSAVETMAAQQQADSAKLQLAQSAANSALDAVRLTWGREIGALLLDGDRTQLIKRLSQREEILLQVGFGNALNGQAPPPQIRVTASGDGQGQPASLVGSAIQTDPQLGAATYFYRTQPGELRAGARLQVVLDSEASGVLVPFDAIVWHAGKAWAYVLEGNGKRGTQFERRLVSTRDEVGGGWINSKNFKAGDQVVSSGAQLLLSEELRKSAVDDD